LEIAAYGPRDEGEDICGLRSTNGNDRADGIDKEGPDDHSLKYLLYAVAAVAVYQHITNGLHEPYRYFQRRWS
jgi:hypothetical protein